jgi:hypothetical protein
MIGGFVHSQHLRFAPTIPVQPRVKCTDKLRIKGWVALSYVNDTF